jgi:FtsP/CotA-like multicopper oxidase with cupredoxin domain
MECNRANVRGRCSFFELGFLFRALSITLLAPLGAGASELQQLPICTFAEGIAPKDVCTVTPLGGGHNEIKINLTAQTGEIEVAGYSVTTDHYNKSYLTPVVEAQPGDRVAAHIVNILQARPQNAGSPHSDHDHNPTNLHYFHGGIVTPNNARPKPAELGDGDNVYVHLRAGTDPQGTEGNSFDLKVPIPGEGELDARVLESTGYIAHPFGLNWYHSHLHGISSTQVMGGMSGLLSIGEATANVKAVCKTSPEDPKCLKDTAELRQRTDFRYALLRDISLEGISKRPDEDGNGTATWAPMLRNFPAHSTCGAWDGNKLNTDNPKLRLGFCQRDTDKAWLFTLNGQRFPTITVAGGRNLLIRLGNVSANIGYLLELYNEETGKPEPLTVLSIDGVVPARPVGPDQADIPLQAVRLDDLLMMPASRGEFYVRNDQLQHPKKISYVLRTKGLSGIGKDEWPEIQLARIDLEPNASVSDVALALNASIAKPPPFLDRAGHFFAMTAHALLPEQSPPMGCVDDLNPNLHEYRRVSFTADDENLDADKITWGIRTEIVQPKLGEMHDEGDLESDPNDKRTIKSADEGGVPFEDYVLPDGTVNWEKPHVCIKIDRGSHAGSHKQLWVLANLTSTLHNFHIHQMKFRLATRTELQDDYHIIPPDPASSCSPPNLYECFDDLPMHKDDPKTTPLFWHDTIPVPPGGKVFIVMSYDADQQIGRFVFHCHILKHEDHGLMAPIEVWQPQIGMFQ